MGGTIQTQTIPLASERQKMTRYYKRIPPTTVIGTDSIVLATVDPKDASSLTVSLKVADATITSASIQILPLGKHTDDATAADWVTIAKDADLKPASIAGYVIGAGGVGEKGISELTDGVSGTAQVILPDCTAARVAVTASDAGTIEGSIAFKASESVNTIAIT